MKDVSEDYTFNPLPGVFRRQRQDVDEINSFQHELDKQLQQNEFYLNQAKYPHGVKDPSSTKLEKLTKDVRSPKVAKIIAQSSTFTNDVELDKFNK